MLIHRPFPPFLSVVMQYTMLLQQCNNMFHESHCTYSLSYGADSSCPLYLPVFTPVRSSFIPLFAAVHLQYLLRQYILWR
jgi:hypothetical protein